MANYATRVARAQSLGFSTPYQQRKASVQQRYGFSTPHQLALYNLDQAARDNIKDIWPDYPNSQLNLVMRRANDRMKARIRDASEEDFRDGLGTESGIYYH